MKTSRDEVYAAVDGEREYQDAEYSNVRPVDEELELMAIYHGKAIFDKDNALRMIRKIAGIAVRCMENHGAPKR